MPPLLPDFDIIPIALVSLIHFCGDILNLLLPASFLNSYEGVNYDIETRDIELNQLQELLTNIMC